jgi:hypothetical protein
MLPIFIPLTKVDVEKREVYGCAAIEVPDGKEICDVEKSIPYFEALAKRCLAESQGKKVAPLREMHQLKAAGNVVEFSIDRQRKVIEARSVVTDEEAFQKVLDGTYCGYSMGGTKLILGPDRANPGIRRYVAMPNEISLVDMGQIPGTQIALVKAMTCEVTTLDGTTERSVLLEPMTHVSARKDVSPADKHSAESEYGDVTYADATNKKYPLDSEAHVRAALSYWGMPKNRAKYSAADQETIGGRIRAAAKRFGITVGGGKMEKGIGGAEPLAKNGLWNVSRFAQIIDSLVDLCDGVIAEGQAEGGDPQDAAQATRLKGLIVQLGGELATMVQEEVAEIAAGTEAPDDESDDAPLTAADGSMEECMEHADAPPWAKKMRKAVQQMHDQSCAMGAACHTTMTNAAPPAEEAADEPGKKEEEDMNGEEMTKAVRSALGLAEEETLAKAVGAIVAERVEAATTTVGTTIDEKIAAALAPLTERLEKASTEIAELRASRPAGDPKGAVTAVITREHDIVSGGQETDKFEKLAKAVEVQGKTGTVDSRDQLALMRETQRLTGRNVGLEGVRAHGA